MTELSLTLRDLPMTVAGCHGRIGAYRDALQKALWALEQAHPYMTGSFEGPAEAYLMERVEKARDQARAELAVTNP